MRLQRATRCALFAVAELAGDPERQVSAAEIAEKYGLSVNHLAKVLRELARARIITSVRGAGGGYTFAANPRRLTLYDIVSRFEELGGAGDGPAEPGAATDAGRALDRVLTEIDEITVATLKSISLATFLKLSRRQNAD